MADTIKLTLSKPTENSINDALVEKKTINLLKTMSDEEILSHACFRIGFMENTLDEFLSNALDGDIEEWKKKNYSSLRGASYPEIKTYLDAQVKINSDDEEIRNEGELQLKEYYEKCMTVKQKYPKK